MGRHRNTEDPRERAERRYPGLVEALGTAFDQHLAQRFGLSRSAVHQLRTTLGIPAFVESPQALLERRYPGVAAQLGRRTDQAIAERYGVSHTAVQLWRKVFDVPAHRPVGGEFGEAVDRRHPGLRARLGLASDTDVGREFGLGRSRVGAIRDRLGIPAWTPPLELGRAMYEARLGGRTWLEVAALHGARHAPSAIAAARRWARQQGRPWPPEVDVFAARRSAAAAAALAVHQDVGPDEG